MSETPSSIDNELDSMLQEGERVERLAELISARRRYHDKPQPWDENTPTFSISHESALLGARLGQLWSSYYLKSLGPDDKYLSAEVFKDKWEAAEQEAINDMQSREEYAKVDFNETPVKIAARDAFFLLAPASPSDGKAVGWGMEVYSDVSPLPTQRYDS